ncbi:MAG TPA: Gfo/Idh/MocA family oxidoreductase [Candidatus Sumerlaeota bacterium]|nr:Gfo/Idh/MocA family oxidoreductase [Candidatus Sumerlaeota bacterium]
MKKIRVGVVGTGHLGQHHARILSKMANCELVGVADTDEKTARSVAKDCKTQAFYHHRHLLDCIDAVSIAVPTVSHFEVAKDFFNNGVHVFLEKPITKTVEEADELIALARQKGLIFQVGHIEHFNPAILKLKEIVDRPLFVESHRLGPFSPRVKDIGVVHDLMIHDIDIILRIVDSPVESFDAVGVPILTDKEDIANVRIRFKSGCTANVTVSRVTPKPMRKIRIFQKDNYISIDYSTQSMEVYTKVPVPNPKPGEVPAKIVRKAIKIRTQNQLELELDHFLDCVEKGRTPVVTGEQAREALQTITQISDQIREKITTWAPVISSS